VYFVNSRLFNVDNNLKKQTILSKIKSNSAHRFVFSVSIDFTEGNYDWILSSFINFKILVIYSLKFDKNRNFENNY